MGGLCHLPFLEINLKAILDLPLAVECGTWEGVLKGNPWLTSQ